MLSLKDICTSDFIDELKKYTVKNHDFESPEYYYRSEEFSYINIICNKCKLTDSIVLTCNIQKLIVVRNQISTTKGVIGNNRIKALYSINNIQCLVDAYGDMISCEEMIIKNIIE